MRVVLISEGDWIGTDELTVEFYACPDCAFERVPYGYDHSTEADQPDLTAKFCPGCGIPIRWLV